MVDGVRISCLSLRIFFVSLLDVPTVTIVATRSMLTTEASTEKYMLVAPESTMSVAFFCSAHCWRVWATFLMSGKDEVILYRVVLKLAI